GDAGVYAEEMRRICVCSRERGIPLEINFLGIRDNRPYPREDFWTIAGQEHSPVTFGFDAHDTLAAYDGDSLPRARELVDTFGLNYIGEPTLIPLK
ncbi:MAG: hypothetical protein IJN00_03880, partial [Clostridia bacterium]|nr:hypothetical protein [Clostridia bacterium]